MAPVPTPTSAKKRSADDAGIDNQSQPGNPKRRATRRLHHKLHYRQEIQADSLVNYWTEEASQAMLERSIAIALNAVGFDGAEEVALVGFRMRVEEYMQQFLRQVNDSMTAGLRRTPVPHDFVHALSRHNLQLNSLLPHLDPPVVPETDKNGDPVPTDPALRQPIFKSKSEIMPLVELEDLDTSTLDAPAEQSTLGIILNENTAEARSELIPRCFPPLPSRHTYKAHAVLPPREDDPQKIREKATEDGRLGEEALRRFTAKVAEIKAKQTTTRAQPNVPQPSESFAQRAGGMWKDLMDSLAVPQTNGHGGMGDDRMVCGGVQQSVRGAKELLSGPVNAESKYWRKLPKRLAEKT